jgi:hypothetical protein
VEDHITLFASTYRSQISTGWRTSMTVGSSWLKTQLLV